MPSESGGKMQTFYRLESAMGGYIGVSLKLTTARKLALRLSKQHGYPVKVFKAKRNALRETHGELVFTAKPEAMKNPGRGKAITLRNMASVTIKRAADGSVQVSGRRIGGLKRKAARKANPKLGLPAFAVRSGNETIARAKTSARAWAKVDSLTRRGAKHLYVVYVNSQGQSSPDGDTRRKR